MCQNCGHPNDPEGHKLAGHLTRAEYVESSRPTPIIKVEHHGREVFALASVQGQHRDHCLCFRCDKLKVGQPDNCPIADAVFGTCVKFGLVTPVYECPEFREKP